MKKTDFYWQLLMVIAMIVMSVCLGSCDLITEEIEVEKLVRDTVEIPGEKPPPDTVKVPVFIDRIRIDSIPYPVLVYDTAFIPLAVKELIYDTLYLPGEPYPVYVYDSIHVVQHHYNDTLFVFPGRTIYHVPEYLAPIVQQFYLDAMSYGWQPMGGSLLIDWWTHEEAPPTNRSSFTFNVYTNGQWVIKLKDTLTPEESYTPIYREMARYQLRKAYTADGTIMDPSFDPKKLTLNSPASEKKKYLDILFASAN